MSKRKTNKKNNIKIKEEQKDLFWDDLITPAEEIRKNLADINANLKAMYEKYEEYFNNPEIAKIYTGIGKALEEIVKNYTTLRSLHSKTEGDVIKYYSGKVNPDDQKQLDLYINISMAYGGVTNQILVLTNTSIVALTNALQTLLDKENEENNKPKEEEDKDGGK